MGSPEELVHAAPDLEALPIVAQRALTRLQDGEATINGMAQLLGTDQALAAAVLRQVNSAEAMPVRRIGNLREALARIGLRPLWDLLLKAVAGPMLDRGLPPYALSRRTAWRHAATTSRAARFLSVQLRVGNPEEASVSGLLHDVGKTIFTTVIAEATAEVVSVARVRALPVWQAERAVLGFDHGAVGAVLMRSWGLPEVVADAVEHHHGTDAATSPLAWLIHVADVSAHLVGAPGGAGACPAPELDGRALDRLGIDRNRFSQLLSEIHCVDEGGL